MSDFNFFCDRALVNKVPQELVSYLRLKGFILPEQKKIHFVGLIYLHTGIYIFLPRNSNISSIIKSNVSLKHEIARNLLLSIHKYFQSSRNILTGADENEHITGEKSLNLLITLLEDYNTNGLYKRRNRRIVKNSGKVDWNRTIKKCESTIDENTLNFLDHIGTRSVVDTTNEISKIHAEIIRQISKNFGWLTFASNEHYEDSLNHIPISHMDSINKIKSIEHEILLTYSDRDIFLLKSLEDYILDVSKNGHSDLIIGIREFHGMWERMLEKSLTLTIDINHRLTAPLYKISDEYIFAAQKGQKTDIAIQYKDRIIIIDAKYYGASNIKNSPSLYDIVKQFFYAKSLKIAELSISKIDNVFVFPGQTGSIQSIHMATKSTKKIYSSIDCLDKQYPPIICFYQDPLELLNYYSQDKKDKSLTQKIISVIDNST